MNPYPILFLFLSWLATPLYSQDTSKKKVTTSKTVYGRINNEELIEMVSQARLRTPKREHGNKNTAANLSKSKNITRRRHRLGNVN
jgi:hypothetical protein